MNAKWLEKFVVYRNSGNGMDLLHQIISQKIVYQFGVVGMRLKAKKFIGEIKNVNEGKKLLLVEARAAKEYWRYFEENVKARIDCRGRRPRGNDALNNLLDVGYHYLSQKVSRVFEETDIPADLGILHKAQSKNAKPLVYDFMEWLRPIVDDVLMKFIRKKKKYIERVSQKEISYFLFLVKGRFEKDFYNKRLKYCISLKYWIKLVALEMRGAVSENRKAIFNFPSLRHENRCKTNPAHQSGGINNQR